MPNAPWPMNSAATEIRRTQWTCRSRSLVEDIEKILILMHSGARWGRGRHGGPLHHRPSVLIAWELERPRLDHLDDLVAHRIRRGDVRAEMDAGPDRRLRDLVRNRLHRRRIAREVVPEDR